MARQIRIEYPGAIYHVTSRGNDRQAIYETKSDRYKFLGLLEQACKRYQWSVYSYCLMDNHYHLLIETREATLSKGMGISGSDQLETCLGRAAVATPRFWK